MKTLVELMGPNLEANLFLLKESGIKNYVIPFVFKPYTPKDSRTSYFLDCVGLKRTAVDIENKYAMRFLNGRFIYPRWCDVYHIDSTYDECLAILIKTYQLKPIEEIKLEML